MLTENREYNYIGKLTLHRSKILDVKHQPKDDKVNWLFLNTENKQFSFVYKIENPLKANYDTPFKVRLSFTMIEMLVNVVKLNCVYEVSRGQEIIGTVKLIKALDNKCDSASD